MRLLNFAGKFIGYSGKLFALPVALFTYIMDVFGYGWDRNRAIDSSGGANPNALMGGYLLAASNTTLSISGILTTDTISPLTTGGLVGTVAVNNTMSFVTGSKYGAFEVRRGGVLIGRYCLTERQGLILTNQYNGAGALPNASIGGTTTTVWQRSNEFYSETNSTGYSLSGTGWVTNTGAAITVNTLIPADLVNTTKCLAWIAGVQQDLQYVGRAKNSVSVVPLSFWFNYDRYYLCSGWNATASTHGIEIHYIPLNSAAGWVYGNSNYNINHTVANILYIKYNTISLSINITDYIGVPCKLIAGFNAGTLYISITNLNTGQNTSNTQSGYASTITANTGGFAIGYQTKCYLANIMESLNGAVIHNYVISQYSNVLYDCTTKGVALSISGVSTNLAQNIDCGYNFAQSQGYRLVTNGSAFLILCLADDGTNWISSPGYVEVETIAKNGVSFADSRISAFKYTLANSHELRKVVPEAYNTDATCTPKLLTYQELSALSANSKVIKTEAGTKITNLKIIQ